MTLLALPDEIIRAVLIHTTGLGLLRAASTCRQLRAVEAQHREDLWEAIYRDARFTPKMIGLHKVSELALMGTSWKRMYKTAFSEHAGEAWAAPFKDLDENAQYTYLEKLAPFITRSHLQFLQGVTQFVRRAALAHSGSPTRAAATATAGRSRLLVLIGVLLRSHRILHASGAAAGGRRRRGRLWRGG